MKSIVDCLNVCFKCLANPPRRSKPAQRNFELQGLDFVLLELFPQINLVKQGFLKLLKRRNVRVSIHYSDNSNFVWVVNVLGLIFSIFCLKFSTLLGLHTFRDSVVILPRSLALPKRVRQRTPSIRNPRSLYSSSNRSTTRLASPCDRRSTALPIGSGTARHCANS
ncbi:hypothetical protein M758_UG172100 [Ceratodon purpureus]|nr:hypothetical protein M758_UG172100 [Ceratodon purpureus]